MAKRHKSGIVGGFIALPLALVNSPKYRALSSSAVKLLIDMASQYNGKNNGDLSAAWKVMQPKGWRSEATLNRAKKELLASQFIAETRKGRLPNLCSLYGVTFKPLNPNPKMDIGPNGFPAGAWAHLPPARLIKTVTATTKTEANRISTATVLKVDKCA